MNADLPITTPSTATSPPRSSTMRQDMLAAYVAAIARIGAWAMVSAIVYRRAGPEQFATLALVRGTIGILSYTSVGLAPALVRHFARAAGGSEKSEVAAPLGAFDEHSIFSTGFVVSALSGIVGLAFAAIYAACFSRLHVVAPSLRSQTPWAVLAIAGGVLLRLFSDASGALLQTRGKIALDNYLLAASDGLWALAVIALFHSAGLLAASIAYALAATFLVVARSAGVMSLLDTPWPPALRAVRSTVARTLLSFGSLVLLSQLAEYFYAPTDYILINHFFTARDVAAYAPGVQIDLGLLMLVSGVAAVLLPKSALAYAAGAPDVLYRYYFRGTLASTVLLLLAACAVWVGYPLIFRILFGPHPPNTHAILDLVLIGTVVGGSSGVGRSILIGMGKIRAFTTAAIVAGVANVAASFCFAKFTHFGLRGILYGTLIAVVGRCGIWMPWYVIRTLKSSP